MLLGPWALAQGQALKRNGADVLTVSLNPWLPAVLARSPGARAYALCPTVHRFGELEVRYPRWLHYPIHPLKRWAYPSPQRQLSIGWHSAAGALRKIVREFRPDVLFAHHAAVNGYVCRKLQEEFGLPYVVTDHDFDEVRSCEDFPARRALFAEVYGHAATVVAVARRMETDMRRLFPTIRTQTIHNGVDPIAPAMLKTERPAQLQHKLVVFSAGMFYERKGFPLLIEAFARVAALHPNAVLRIAGDGDEREKIQAAIRAAGIADRVTLLGKLPHEAVLQEMAWSDLFALIGWDEPFATVFIEAMSAGKPLLCANDGGINDVVVDGVQGRTVPPRDVGAAATALDQMLGDGAAREKMGNAARELVAERLTWDANAAAMLNVFRAGLLPK